MRPRAEIEGDRDSLPWSATNPNDETVAALGHQRLQLEVLLDIRDQLAAQAADVARCPHHGTTGLCMTCVLVYDLLRQRSS